MPHVQIFLSTVSAEFRSYRDALRHDLARPNVSVAVQEDFIVTGTETLDMLDDHIRQCDAVIHLVGDMTGAPAQAPSLAAIRDRYPDLGDKLPPLAPFLVPSASALPYTQWEAWLALYHRKPLLIAVPDAGAPRDATYRLIAGQRDTQQAHLQRLAQMERYPFRFANADRLAVKLLRSGLFGLFVAAGVAKRVMNLPLATLGDLFKGRGQWLDDLHARLAGAPANGATAIVGKAVHGLGGVGKTRLAVEYALRHENDYTALLFVLADSPEALERNLAGLCAVLELPEHKVTEVAVQFAAVMRWLQRNPGWLLILDNVNSEPAAQAVEALLPQLPGGQVLITGRLSNWSGSVDALPLDVLNEAAAVDFLLARTEPRRRKQADDAEQARLLAEELGGLALALEQAGAYIAQRRLTLADYLTEWRSQRDKVLTWYDERLMHYPKSVAVTWQTSFDQLGEPARRLLQRLAWLAPDPIPESLLDVAVPDPPTDDDAHAALAELEAYSLVTRAADAPAFAVHRLVQTVTRRGAEGVTLTEALEWINVAFVGDPQDVRTWPTLTPLLPHVRAVASYADEAGIAGPTARLMNQAGGLLLTGALYAQAEPLFARALAIDEEALGPDHPYVAQSLNNMAELYRALRAYEKVEPLHMRALAIRGKALGPEHPDVALSLNNLALHYYDQGAYEYAEPLYARALAISEKVLGPEHPLVATSLNNLATLYHDLGAYEKAEPLYARALAIREKALGPEHSDVATSLDNLAGLCRTQGAYEKAEPLFARALAIRKKALGPEHPNVATSLNNLALLYHDQGAYEKTEPLYSHSLAILEKALGPEHPDVVPNLNNLAVLYSDQGAYEKAEPLFARALAIRENALEPEHPYVAQSLNNLAELYGNQGAYEKAEPLHARALAISAKALGPEHPDVATSLNNLAELYRALGAYEKVEPLLMRALSIREKALGPKHPDVAVSLNSLAGLYLHQGAYVKAESRLARALAIWEEVLGPEHPDVATSVNNLATLYHDLGGYEKAERLYARALAIREKALGPEHPDVATSVNNLALLYDDKGAYEKAERLFARALSILVDSLGEDHPDTIAVRRNHELLLAEMGKRKLNFLRKLQLAIRKRLRHVFPDESARS